MPPLYNLNKIAATKIFYVLYLVFSHDLCYNRDIRGSRLKASIFFGKNYEKRLTHTKYRNYRTR